MAFYTYMDSEVFESKEDLISEVRNYGHAHGFHPVLQRSKPHKIWIICDKGGRYHSRLPRELFRNTSTKKTGCSFCVTGVNVSGSWQLETVNAEHNHLPSDDIAGHSGARRLLDEERNLIASLATSGAAPRVIRSSLQSHNNENISNMRDIYNSLAQQRRELLNGRTPIQFLIEELERQGIESSFDTDDENHVNRLCFAPHSAVSLTNLYPTVFLLDCTYKTNRFKA